MPSDRMDQRGLSLIGVSDPPSWLNDTTWIHPALVIMGLWGIGAGIIVNTAGLRNPHGVLRRGGNRRGLVGAVALRDPADDVASHLLHTHPRSRGGDAVLPRPPSSTTGPGPGGSTLFYNLYLYKTFFTFQEMGYGATLAWLLFGVILVVTFLPFRLSRRWVFYAGER